jgi:hypothetical protein
MSNAKVAACGAQASLNHGIRFSLAARLVLCAACASTCGFPQSSPLASITVSGAAAVQGAADPGNTSAAASLCPPFQKGGLINSTTLAPVPHIANSRACIGVGESVLLTTAKPAKWTISSSAPGFLFSAELQPAQFPANFIASDNRPLQECSTTAAAPQVDGVEACFTAPYQNATVVITAAFADGTSAHKTFAVLEPSGLVFQRVQWPKGKPDYLFDSTAAGYRFDMTSAVFLAPGNVSFANIEIEELAAPNPRLAPTSNLLFRLEQGDAWFLGCDREIDASAETNPKLSQWAYADRTGAHKTQFAYVKTQWAHKPPNGYQYSKGQAAALAPTGNFALTPETPATTSILSVPENSPAHNDWVWPATEEQCRDEVKDVFSLIP